MNVTVHTFYPPVADFILPRQGVKMYMVLFTQGVALGWSVLPFQGE